MFDKEFVKQYNNKCFLCEKPIEKYKNIIFYAMSFSKDKLSIVLDKFPDGPTKEIACHKECFTASGGDILYFSKRNRDDWDKCWFCKKSRYACESVSFFWCDKDALFNLCTEDARKFLGEDFLFSE